jgi:glycosyltransferase involved in cell wall biosynthesis
VEWIEDGKSGFSIPAGDSVLIADRLRRALTDDELVDGASAINRATVKSRLDQAALKQQAIRFYEEIFQGYAP